MPPARTFFDRKQGDVNLFFLHRPHHFGKTGVTDRIDPPPKVFATGQPGISALGSLVGYSGYGSQFRIPGFLHATRLNLTRMANHFPEHSFNQTRIDQTR